MYEELIAKLRDHAEWYNEEIWAMPITIIADLSQAADAIEELSKGQKHLAEQVAKWQAEAVKGDCEAWLSEQDKPRWIPVTERLPEKEDEAVIVWEKQGCALIDWRHDNKWAVLDNNFGIATHWMPLPEPPKEE